MTGTQKNTLAGFLDLVEDFNKSGHITRREEYDFPDDPDLSLNAASRDTAAVHPADDSLEAVAGEVLACTACGLCQGRTNAVPGEGVNEPLIMVIGEGPGFDEDKTGRPFVGRAGQLLDKMLASVGLSRDSNCFIANVVKCRPPNNRDPLPEETGPCSSFLSRQITLLKPLIILSVGRISAQALLATSEPIGSLRGRFTQFHINNREIPLLPTYHPSALLRNESLKRPAWEDLKKLRDKLMELAPDYNPGNGREQPDGQRGRGNQ